MRHVISCFKLLSLLAFLLAAPVALAWGRNEGPSHRPSPGRPSPVPTHAVPEFDPAAGGAVAALLAGGGLVLAGRRKAK